MGHDTQSQKVAIIAFGRAINERWRKVVLPAGAILILLGATSAPAQDGGDTVAILADDLTPAQQRQLVDLFPNEASSGDGVIRIDRSKVAKALHRLDRDELEDWASKIAPLGGYFDSGIKIQRVYEPMMAVAAIEASVVTARADCEHRKVPSLDADACLRSKAVPEFERMLESIKSNSDQCDHAAKAYQEFLYTCSNCDREGRADKQKFDAACLSSNISWRRSDGKYRADPEPAVLRVGGDRDGVSGASDAVVIIEMEAISGRVHVCGGLLLSGNRVLTAQHCFVTPLVRNALQEGRMYARPVSGQADKRYRLLYSDSVADHLVPPASDFIVLGFESKVRVPAPRVVFDAPRRPGPAFVYGYFSDFDATRELEGGASISTWKQGLRWTKSGLCHVIETINGCARLLCQTVPGYSGAPVFSANAVHGQPLVVHGVISDANDSNESMCGLTDTVTTLAAVPTGVMP